MRRREFITGLGSAAVAWPVVARAQQPERVRRIGVLMPGDETDPEMHLRYSAFTQALADLGWTDGRNVRMDLRWAGDDILFAFLANPNSPITAFETKELEAAAGALGVRLLIVNAARPDEFGTAFATIAQQRAGALLVSSDALFSVSSLRVQFATLATHNRIPAAYANRNYVAVGGLMSYGTSPDDMSQVGVYTGNILKGAKPADLPVMQSTKFELVINLKTAKALGLTIPETLLATADEVIQ
jgi:putative ABC transport system substrate-binding protein